MDVGGNAAFVVPGETVLADVLSQAVGLAGLSASDGPVVAAERLLSGHFFKNAMTLRFKRNKYGSWRWLEDIPFCLPMCLADLIGHLLDQKFSPYLSRPMPVNCHQSSNAALRHLLGSDERPPSNDGDSLTSNHKRSVTTKRRSRPRPRTTDSRPIAVGDGVSSITIDMIRAIPSYALSLSSSTGNESTSTDNESSASGSMRRTPRRKASGSLKRRRTR
ncbi:Uncharacterized protein PBTT_07574 [Plasmodiophora brassicae]